MSIVQELKRRNVFRVAIAYIVVAWLVLQVADVVLNNITAPGWVFQALMLFLAVGLPIALLFAWAYELTPDGLKREKDVDRSQSITHHTGRRLDFLIIGVLVVAVGMLLVDKFLLPDFPITVENIADDGASPPEAAPSIAVLPFTNMSGDESSAYFSDGLADTVLHMLAQVHGLHVAARTSSFQFRGQSLDIAKIGDQLNVSTILEGGVQRSGDKIRVTAQLIDVSTGYHLWSGNFDRDLDDIFAIQDEIANEVVAALKVSLLGEGAEHLKRGQTDNIDAYTEYLLAINDLNNVSTESLASAVNHLQEAIRLDPEYARAYSTLGRAYFSMEGWGAMGRTEATAAARDTASRALDIAADSSEALAVLGHAERRDGNMEIAGRLLKKAIDNGPNNTVALDYYARYLNANDRPVEGIEIYREILHLDPLSENAHVGLASALASLQQFSEASETIARFKGINPKSPFALSTESLIEDVRGHYAAAITSMTNALMLDPNDPEGPAWIGHLYLALDMPAEAERWFDRAVETDAQHPASRAAPLFLNYYLQRNEVDNFRLARELLEDRVDDRIASHFFAFVVLAEHAEKGGRNDVALEVLDNLYPHLFDDPPHDLDKDLAATYFAGLALIQSGDINRGSHLMRSYLDLVKPNDEAYFVRRASVEGRLILGDVDAALDKLEDFAEYKYYWAHNKLLLERSSVFDPIRNEPAFIALLDEYRKNAEEQRQILQAMNDDASGK